MRFRGVLFERLGSYGARVESAFDVPWAEAAILDVFGEQPAVDKSAQQLWGAAEYYEHARRGNAGLNVVYAAVLDCDCADVGQLDAVIAHVRNRGLACLAYTSWSHGDPAKHHRDSDQNGPFDAFRIVLPYDRPITPDEHRSVVPGLFGHELPADPPHYAREVFGRFTEHRAGPRAARPRGWDPASARPSQAYYVPSARSSVDVFHGSPLAVDAILARPTTARVATQRSRPYARPSAQATAAMDRVLALVRNPSAPGFEGWHRAPCPACAPDGVQRSPSFRARANGDGIDAVCFAGCRRAEIFGALGLTPAGVYRAPTHLRIRIEEQLASQTPPNEALDVASAVVRLERDIREAVHARTPTVVRYPAGTGKSFASATVISEVARAGYRIAYATQEHVVAHETRSLLPPDVHGRSVHLHSPLVQVGAEPVCRRADELRARVFEFGVSLLGQVCPRCVYRESCEAYAGAKARAQALPDAAVIFTSHAGIRQIFGMDRDGNAKGADTLLIVDEMPAAFDDVTVTRAELELLVAGAPMPSAQTKPARAAVELARAWLTGTEPGEVSWGGGGESWGSAEDIAREWGRLALREGAVPHPVERPALRSADAVLRIATASPADVAIDADGICALLPGAAHQALVDRAGVLLTATPMMAALRGFTLREASVRDGAPVRRTMIAARDRGSKALAGDGVPWLVVDAAVARARAEAAKYTPPRILFVSFKAVIDAMRSRGVPDDIELAHFGALRGKNDWMEGRRGECSVIYLLGSPRFAMMPTIRHLGLVGEAADQAWIAFAAGELEQAEGRLRLPRRRRPCSVIAEGDVAPSSWHAENIDELIELDD